MKSSPSPQMSGKARSMVRWLQALMQSWQSRSWFVICSRRSKLDWEDNRSLLHASTQSAAILTISTQHRAWHPTRLGKHLYVVIGYEHPRNAYVSLNIILVITLSPRTAIDNLARARHALLVNGTRRKRIDCIWNLWSNRSHIIHDATVLSRWITRAR